MIGIGAMVSLLSADEHSRNLFKSAVGKKITSLGVHEGEYENTLRFKFSDGSGIELYDDGQNCCERRWMSCDDDLGAFVGASLVGAEVRDGPAVNEEPLDYYDTEFLIVTTSLGQFTCVNHNEHNGYYCGFSVRCREVA